MPSHKNGYIARSLYIDEVGRYKDLTLNDRASRIAQRDVRGDCFVLSNMDDPARSTWERKHTALDEVENMINFPPARAPDPMSQTGMALAVERTEAAESVLLTSEEVGKAKASKERGNIFYRANNYENALGCYMEGLKRLIGRSDDFDNEGQMEVAELRRSLSRNAGLSCFKLKNYKASVRYASEVLQRSFHLQTLYLRIQANILLKDFDACAHDLEWVK
mmetsp:Transcript_10104/g.13606  ORF Transcript_10104/g.13606 Transcript_10104/m.13606 type:complete len:220 (+) Transcript_10104:2-661(+)